MTAQATAQAKPEKGELKWVQLTAIRLNNDTVAIRKVKQDSQKFQELLESIRTRGIMQPIKLRHIRNEDGSPSGFYGMVAGLHRFTAASILRLNEIPALITDVKDDEMIENQLIENIQRVQMKGAEEAQALYMHIQSHPNQSLDEIAQRCSKSIGWLHQRLAIVKLPTKGEDGEEPLYGVDVQELINDGKINPSNAYNLSKLVLDPPVPKEFWLAMVEAAQTVKSADFTTLVQLRLSDVKKGRQANKVAVVDPNQRIPSIRGKAELVAHLERIEFKVQQDTAAGKPTTDFTKGVIHAFKFALQIDDTTWAERKKKEAEEASEKERKKQERVAGALADSLKMAGLAPTDGIDFSVPKQPIVPESAEELLGAVEAD